MVVMVIAAMAVVIRPTTIERQRNETPNKRQEKKQRMHLRQLLILASASKWSPAVPLREAGRGVSVMAVITRITRPREFRRKMGAELLL